LQLLKKLMEEAQAQQIKDQDSMFEK